MLWEQSCARIMPSIEIALAMATVAKLNRIWRCNTISFASKFKLYKPLVTPILLYGCETWTLLAGSEKKKRKDPGFRNQVHEETCPHNLHGSGTSHARQRLQTHPSGYLGGWATPWSVEEMLDGQHQRVDIPAHARTAHKGPPVEKTGRGSLLNRPSCIPNNFTGQGAELNWSLLSYRTL